MFFLFDGISLQNRRKSNMDSLCVQEKNIEGKGVLLAVVCDGVGSMEDGAYAASTAINGMSEWFSRTTKLDRIDLRMRDEVLKINNGIFAVAERDGLHTAATLSALLLVEETYHVVHIGDSRIYAVDKDGLVQMTPDDVSETGGLTGCVGHVRNPVVYCAQGNVDGKLFLLCSDGLYKRMDMEFLLSQLSDIFGRKDMTKAIDDLTRFVIEKGESDNISLILVKINDGGKYR